MSKRARFCRNIASVTSLGAPVAIRQREAGHTLILRVRRTSQARECCRSAGMIAGSLPNRAPLSHYRLLRPATACPKPKMIKRNRISHSCPRRTRLNNFIAQPIVTHVASLCCPHCISIAAMSQCLDSNEVPCVRRKSELDICKPQLVYWRYDRKRGNHQQSHLLRYQ